MQPSRSTGRTTLQVSFVSGVGDGGLSTAVMSGFKGQAIVNDEGKDRCRDKEGQRVADGVFHGLVW